jgi:hypothetical protein
MPADDPPRQDVNDEGRVHETLPYRDLREIADPQLVRTLCLELPVHPIRRAQCRSIDYRYGHTLPRTTLLSRIAPLAQRRDLEHLTDRLDTGRIAALVDKHPHDLKRRSNSAGGKNALTRRRSLSALRSSRTSRSSALMCSASAVVGSDAGRYRVPVGVHSGAACQVCNRFIPCSIRLLPTASCTRWRPR